MKSFGQILTILGTDTDQLDLLPISREQKERLSSLMRILLQQIAEDNDTTLSKEGFGKHISSDQPVTEAVAAILDLYLRLRGQYVRERLSARPSTRPLERRN